jgi:hypothetical protein
MAISDDLMLSILAMDSYNRGYGEGIVGLSAAAGTMIGDAKIIRDANDPGGIARSAGFYAVAYDWNGKTVISYRGTDYLTETNSIGGDMLNDYGVGVGSPFGPQAGLAVDFYNAVGD